jgi:peptidoglycan/LPS O-acetylase OafA/YrhL
MRSQTPAHVPALDGLRAFAVALVVVLHSGTGVLVGGGFGVDVFFVLSGYLITTVLLREHDARGRVDLVRFFMRRVFRLAPALVSLILVLVVVAAIVDSGKQFRLTSGLLKECAIAFFYLSDAAAGWGVGEIGVHTPLYATWSLAVEEHFYLIWPPILALLLSRGKSRVLAPLLIGVIAVVILWVAILYILGASHGRIFYSPDTRGLGLLIGCYVAVARPRIPSVAQTSVCGFLAVGLLLAFAVFGMSDRAASFGGLALVDLAAAVCIAAALRPSWFSRAFSARPLVAIGARSYGIYLWHFPVFHFISTGRFPNLGSVELSVLKILVTAVAVELSYRLIERPALAFGRRVTGVKEGAETDPPATPQELDGTGVPPR